jgi:TRAP transporter TAXI family solute receptor
MQRTRLGPWTIVVTMLAALATLTACSGGGESGKSGGAAGDGANQRFISLGTAPAGGAFFVVGGAIGETLNEFRGERPWEVTAEATKGSQENIRRLDSGEIDLALSNSAISYFALRGSEGWDKPYPIRAVMTLAPNVAFFIAPQASGVKSIPDLAGKRVVIGPAGAGFHYFVRPLVEAHGLDYDSMQVLHGPQSAAVDMLADGSAAAAFLGGAVPTASITQASTSQDIFFVPIDPDAVTKLTEQYLFFRPATIPAGTYRGQEADYHGLDVGSMHLITSADKDEELIYEVTKALYEHRESVTARHPAGRAINPKNVVRDTGTEFHPGAIRYYREIGIWPEGASSE